MVTLRNPCAKKCFLAAVTIRCTAGLTADLARPAPLRRFDPWEGIDLGNPYSIFSFLKQIHDEIF